VTKSVYTEEYNQFRKMLVAARKSANLTQAELSIKLQRPQSYVSKYERGERRLDLIEFLELAEVLKINPVVFIQQLKDFSKEK
jgi:transcriptional regulator with XRE-family HTH domain